MNKDKVVAFEKPDQAKDMLIELLRSGAQKPQKSWCRLRGFKQLAKVITGVRFRDGIELQERNTGKRIQELGRVAA